MIFNGPRLFLANFLGHLLIQNQEQSKPQKVKSYILISLIFSAKFPPPSEPKWDNIPMTASVDSMIVIAPKHHQNIFMAKQWIDLVLRRSSEIRPRDILESTNDIQWGTGEQYTKWQEIFNSLKYVKVVFILFYYFPSLLMKFKKYWFQFILVDVNRYSPPFT